MDSPKLFRDNSKLFCNFFAFFRDNIKFFCNFFTFLGTIATKATLGTIVSRFGLPCFFDCISVTITSLFSFMKNFIPEHGGYKNLITYQRAEIIYDATLYFTQRYLSRGDRTIDQMVQAARSGKQNIAEASMASGTSKETEIKLTNVARASQEELLIDYRDYMRNHQILEWDRSHPYTARMSDLIRNYPATYQTFRKGIENSNLEISLNVIVALIKVTQFLLSKQIKSLEKDFCENGGLRERMTKARLLSRQRT